ncbi:PREDICTED: putative F-box/kelch-repeat protein At1g15680 [Tarenaya hassleriana]|uniref:putative F-box/kelch-repeat protein At1g15680 n=1 Tax=Tarenaya hassleriana TaxID=28532 RepID=UPI00053C2DA2|nr:PREDICTED: putative F-box/kelch-repeat protein At1g15680 [Tarenaya hassleriana]
MDLPEEMLARILANSSFRDIVRFKLVCREWKSLIESAHFRRLFHSTNHDLSSSAWSLVFNGDGSMNEVVSHCGRDGHCLSRSLGSYTSSFLKDLIRFKNQEGDEKLELQATRRKIKQTRVVACTDGLVLLVVKPLSGSDTYYVSNPVLRQWVEIPPPQSESIEDEDDYFKILGLVTHVENGAVSGYKVVRMAKFFAGPTSLDFQIYSSETGEWTIKEIHCPRAIRIMLNVDPINLNGSLHWLEVGVLTTDFIPQNFIPFDPAILTHDFYANGSEADQFRIISLPDNQQIFPCNENFFTTSGGFLMYINTNKNRNPKVRVWKLKNNGSDSGNDWEMLWDMNLSSIGFGRWWIPKAMHPFETDVIYVWNPHMELLVSFNMRTQDITSQHASNAPLIFKLLTPFVLPRWLESIPCPANLTFNVLPHELA